MLQAQARRRKRRITGIGERYHRLHNFGGRDDSWRPFLRTMSGLARWRRARGGDGADIYASAERAFRDPAASAHCDGGQHSLPLVSRLLSGFGREVIVASTVHLRPIADSLNKSDRTDARPLRAHASTTQGRQSSTSRAPNSTNRPPQPQHPRPRDSQERGLPYTLLRCA